MSRLLLSLALFAAAINSALAAEVRLGPETALTPAWGSAQLTVVVARSGNHEVAVWSEYGTFSFAENHLLASIDGKVLSIGTLGRVPNSPNSLPFAVSVSDTNFLIVWCENVSVSDNVNRMVEQRFTFDGQALDPRPFILSIDSAGPPSVASDGSTYLVTWFSANSVFTVCLADDGTIRSRLTYDTVVNSHVVSSLGGYPTSSRVAWTGNRFLLGSALSYSSFGQPTGRWVDIGSTALDTTGQFSPLRLFDLDLHHLQFDPFETSLALASGGGTVTFAWYSYDEAIVIAQTSNDDAPVGAPRVISNVQRSNVPTTPAIGWDGAEFVVAWIDGGTTLRALRLDQTGGPIEDPFVVATLTDAFSNRQGPSIAPTPDGVVIAYCRPDATSGNVSRAFERTLARLPPSSPRQRAAGHN